MLAETVHVETRNQSLKDEKSYLEKSLANLLYQIDSLRSVHAPNEEIMDLIILFSELQHKYDLACLQMNNFQS